MKSNRLFRYRNFLVVICIAVAVFGMLQINAPVIPNPPVTTAISLPEEVSLIFKRSCYDCHSNETRLTWYDRIAPVSYLVAKDVKEGRARFNFSQWGDNPAAVQELLLWEMLNAVQEGKMPPKSYSYVHRKTLLTEGELTILKNYVNTLPGRHKIDTAKITRPTGNTSVHTEAQVAQISVSLNGVAYSSDYKNWKIISITDKYDGGSMRVVYANDIMVKAIKSGTMPFPDGAKMVKAVWGKQKPDAEGIVRPGNFQNVQFMVKDAKKYTQTEGWGFAKFDGFKLKAYGKTPLFDRACINCHRLLVPENDFVFNIPTKKQNNE